MNKHRIIAGAAGVIAAVALIGPATAGIIPDHPDELTFQPLEFDPPAAADYRYTLSNGVTVFLAPSRELPLISVNFMFKGGEYLEPADKVGLASLTGRLIRTGGAGDLSPSEVDEQFDFLAANANAFIGSTRSGASLNSLSANFDESFNLFISMVRHPAFDSERFRVQRDEMIENMRQRNDRAEGILAREWKALMYGRDHFEARVPTEQTVDNISSDDLRDFHARIFNPANLIITASGDFQVDAMLRRLEQACAGWQAGTKNADPPAPTHTVRPGVYHVEKDIPQGKVRMGQRGMLRDDPDQIAVDVMNDILGGGGFTSRIVTTVRSNEGLAYGAGSNFRHGVYYPGEFVASTSSKNATVALAIKLMLQEMSRIQQDPVTSEELDTTRNAMIETFPRTFESKGAMLGVFADDQMTGRDSTYWDNYRDRVAAVTVDDVRTMAREHLDPENMVILVVGKWDEIAPGDLEGRADMQDLGPVEHLPLRDPLTQEPVEK
ncbi:MAG: insulinase family protein [Phycisphaerales bacterium]|nr:insulinase family protein [Phycisphaerales bacterium]